VWPLAYGHEIGDLCETVSGATEGQTEYQRIWSASAAAGGGDPCVPAPDGPYYSVTTDAPWYAVAAGEAVVIPVGGWSSAPAAPWNVDVRVKKSSAAGFVATWETADGGAPLFSNGSTASLVVTAPATSGAYAVIELRSGPSGGGHQSTWPVGVYVP
jgi:hypothetical protein